MSYKNVVFVKLKWKELLLEDDRFLDLLNDYQKGLYLMLLLLAGATNNNIKNNPEYIKRTLNLSEKVEKITENLGIILKTFPKLISKNGYFKFKNFNSLHNYIGKSQGTPKLVTWEVLDKIRIDKKRIDKVLFHYFTLKGLDKDQNSSPQILPYLYGRFTKPAKELLMVCGLDVDKSIRTIDTLKAWFEKAKLEWTLETIVKWAPEYLLNPTKFTGQPKSRTDL